MLYPDAVAGMILDPIARERETMDNCLKISVILGWMALLPQRIVAKGVSALRRYECIEYGLTAGRLFSLLVDDASVLDDRRRTDVCVSEMYLHRTCSGCRMSFQSHRR